MRKFFNVLFGEVGLFIMCVSLSVVSWFLFPLFIDVVNDSNSLASLFGYLFICPISLGLFLSAVVCGAVLLFKGITRKKWWWILLAILLLVFDIAVVVLNLMR